MLIIELNEFNRELLESASKHFNLPNIQHIISMQHASTMAAEREERFGLDPWVQWVSIHTGKPADEHGIRHLADANKLQLPQVWELVAEKGFSYGVWGCMNAKFAENKNCSFFFCDPWTYSEQAYPEKLNAFLELPRYYAKHYLDLKFTKLCKSAFKSIFFLIKHFASLFSALGITLKTIFSAGINSASLFAYFDLVSAALFKAYRRKTNANFCLIFMNMLAHYQHNCWPVDENYSSKDRAIFTILDKALGLIIQSLRKDEALIVLNSFSQKNTAVLNETLYRQNDPEAFFSKLGLPDFKVEQLMTNDSQLIFSSTEDRNKAVTILKTVSVEKDPAFQVDVHEGSNDTLFCQFVLWREIAQDESIRIGGAAMMPFYDEFSAVIKRTGSHVQQGDIFYNGLILPKTLMNHELSSYILKQYNGLL